MSSSPTGLRRLRALKGRTAELPLRPHLPGAIQLLLLPSLNLSLGSLRVFDRAASELHAFASTSLWALVHVQVRVLLDATAGRGARRKVLH